MLEMKQLRDMAGEELDKKERELRKELFGLRYQLLAGRVDKPSRVKEVRQDIARIHTVRSERKSGPEASN